MTSYPRAPTLGSNVYPRPRTLGIAARHARFADPAHVDFWAVARPGHRARHPADLRGRAPGRARSPLPGARAPGGPRLDFREVGNLDKQPQGSVLFVDGCRSQAARKGNHQMEPAHPSDWADTRVRRWLGHVPAQKESARHRRGKVDPAGSAKKSGCI